MLLALALPVSIAHAEPREPREPDGYDETVTPTVTLEAVVEGLPTVVGELLELRLIAQEAITEAEIARVAAERARTRARAAGFTATVARLRARHARDILERWASSLYRNEIGVHEYVDVIETGFMMPERTLDVSHWLGIVGRDRERGITEANRLVQQAESLERLAADSLKRAEEAERFADVRRAEADVILESTETALRSAVGDNFKHQLTVGPDGCPTNAPDGSIRSSAADDVARLCARSVALAPTPEAALAIKYAFRTLGAAYACDGIGRNLPMRYDCSSLVTRAYSEGAGLLTTTDTWIPTTRNLLPWDGAVQAQWARNIEPEEALPGDLILYDTEHLASRHVVMLLADGHMLHVAECGDFSHVTGFWGYTEGTGYRYLGARRVDPAIARDPTSILDGSDPWLTDGVHATVDALPVNEVTDGDLPEDAVTLPDETAPEGTADLPVRTGPETYAWDTGRSPSRDHELERMTRRYTDLFGVR
jgi:cell wall-associated NlpC family hydrolase